MTIDELYKIIEERKKSMPQNSYTASLLREGQDKILEKIEEEAKEIVNAAKNESDQRTIEEVADLWFHLLVLLSALNIPPSKIFEELQKRHDNKK
ncbi:phosphoribosyl-ATP diphosphatase [Candidatus Microgenomates bacterium]|nr:phosphoribosyl-ATP diphosphatase [Candidatus Microgenomates bacterium]